MEPSAVFVPGTRLVNPMAYPRERVTPPFNLIPASKLPPKSVPFKWA